MTLENVQWTDASSVSRPLFKTSSTPITEFLHIITKKVKFYVRKSVRKKLNLINFSCAGSSKAAISLETCAQSAQRIMFMFCAAVVHTLCGKFQNGGRRNKNSRSREMGHNFIFNIQKFSLQIVSLEIKWIKND